MKKTIALFLTLALLLSGLPMFTNFIPFAGAANDNQAPLTASIYSEKPSYGVFDSVRINVSIKNISEKVVNNISAISSFRDIQPVGSNNTLFVEGRSIQPGETINYSYSGRIKSSKLNLFQKIIMFFKNLFDRPKSVPNKNYDDGRATVSALTDFKIGGYGVQESLTVWFETPSHTEPIIDEPEVVEAKTPDEFGVEVSNIVKEQMSSTGFDQEKANEEPYYSCRLIVCGSNLNSIDLKPYSPDKVIYNNDYSEAIIQFSTQSSARNCEQYLNGLNNVEFAEVDRFICCDVPSDGTAVS